MVRELTAKISTPPPPIPTPVSASTPAEAPKSNGSLPTQSLAITRQEPSSRDIQTLLDKAADEGLVLIQSPRVRTQIEFYLLSINLGTETTNGAGGVI